MKLLVSLTSVVQMLSMDIHGVYRERALHRIGTRDPDDWPVLACAMAIGCPVWTEDTDFFGTGVATWTTDRVDLYFSD